MKEFELLDYPAVAQAFFIKCPPCFAHHAMHDQERVFCEDRAREYDIKHSERLMDKLSNEDKEIVELDSTGPDDQSMTDADTMDDSEVPTPNLSRPKLTITMKRKAVTGPASEPLRKRLQILKMET